MLRDAGKVKVCPSLVNSRHGRSGEGGDFRQIEIVLLGHRERDLSVLEHILERKSHIKVAGDHRGQLKIGQRRMDGVILKGLAKLEEGDPACVEQRERLRKRAHGDR